MVNEQLKEAARNIVQKYASNEISQGFKPDGLHHYIDTDGQLIYSRIRLKNHATGEKWIRPFYLDEATNTSIIGEPKHKFNNGKPLYRLDNIANNPNSPIYIVEGEKCVDALSKLGFIATTSGSCTSANAADWSPLAGKTIFIWPDFNKEGLEYAENVKQIISGIGCEINIIDVQQLNLADKQDCVDWINHTSGDIRAKIVSLPVLKPEDESLLNEFATRKKAINDLAKLDDIEYQLLRKNVAKSLGIQAIALDKLVKQIRSKVNSESSSLYPLIEPWDQPVDGEHILDALENILTKLVVFPSTHEAKAVALHILHTHCIDAADCSPILNISSPEKRCGKTTLLTAIQRLVNRPLIASNISTAATFRSIDAWIPSLIIDEADSFLQDNEEMRGVINSGHTRDSAFVIRCVGDNHQPTRFNTWGPKIIAGIGHLAETLEDRSIIIRLRRKLSDEKKAKLRDIQKSSFDELLRKCVRFADDNTETLRDSRPTIPTSLNDRAADNWSPLLAIAYLAGEKWFKLATDAAISLCGSSQEPVSVGVELLQDIKTIFDTKQIDRLYTGELLKYLNEDTESPWLTYNRGNPLSARQLANSLKEYKVHSKDMRIPPESKNLKGYAYDDFQEAFSRYIPNPDKDEQSNATALQPNDDAGSESSCISDKANMSRKENSLQPISEANCSVVAYKNDISSGNDYIDV